MEVSGKRTNTAEEETTEEIKKLCELCEADHVKTVANGICRECEEFICNTCFRLHLRAKVCRHHVLVDINKSLTPIKKSVENVETCNRHANEAIKYYCRKHEIVGCGDCMIPWHGTCQPENIKELSKEFEQNEDFKSKMAKIEDLMSVNNVSDKKIKESKKENKRMLEEALKAIQNFRSEVSKYLDKAEGNIIKEVKEIERKNDELLAKLEQDSKLLSSEITEVRQKLDTELYKGSALFIQSVECNPKIIDIERACSKIQRENEITTFEFIPDKQLHGIITYIEKLGQVTSIRSFAKQETKTQIKQASREEVKDREKAIYSAHGNAKEGKRRPAEDHIVIGARVRPTGSFHGFYLYHHDRSGTVTAVHPDGRVDVKWDDTALTYTYTVGKGGGVELI